MEIDPRYAHLENEAGKQFQVLKPAEYGTRMKLDDEGFPIPILDEEGNPAVDNRGRPLMEGEEYELPREWDEEATHAAMNDA